MNDHMLVNENALTGSGPGIDNVILSDFTMEGQKNGRKNCIFLDGNDSDRNTNIQLRGLKVDSCGQQGIHIKGTDNLEMNNIFVSGNGTESEHDHNIYLRRDSNITISNVISENAKGNGFNGSELYRLTMTNYIARENGGRGIRVSNSFNVTISSSIALNNAGVGIMFMDEDGGVEDGLISGCVSKGNNLYGIELYMADTVTVTGCVISGNSSYGINETASSKEVIVGNSIVNNSSPYNSGAVFSVYANNYSN